MAHTNLTCSRIHDRNNNLLGAWVRPTCWSWNLQRGGKQLQFTLETIIIFYIIAFFFFQLYLALLVLHCYMRAFSSCGEWGLLYTCSIWGFSLLVASLVSEPGLFQSTQTSVIVVHRHSCCGAKAWWLCSMWDFPGPMIEPVFILVQTSTLHCKAYS